MNRWLATTTCLTMIACGGPRGAATTNPPSASPEGLYEYSASIPGYQIGRTIRVRGTLSVVGDSLFVQPDSGCVLYQPTTPTQVPVRAGTATLHCSEASLNFDRRNLKSGRWYSTVQVPKQRNVCAQYAPRIPPQPARCLHYRPETYYVSERRSGAVQIKPI